MKEKCAITSEYKMPLKGNLRVYFAVLMSVIISTLVGCNHLMSFEILIVHDVGERYLSQANGNGWQYIFNAIWMKSFLAE